MRYITTIALIVVMVFLTQVNPATSGGLDPSIRCKSCHKTIYEQWRSSRHYNSFTDPLFVNIYNKLRSVSPEDSSLCEFCHAPASKIGVMLLNEEDQKKEGISCDFCHTVKEVRPGKGMPRFINTPGIKRGPVDHPKSTHHKTEFSSLHLESIFCAGCHEFENRYGVKVLSTYSEWEDSFYRGEGIHCQYCHLPQLFGDTQFLGDKPGDEKISDHTMRGGHSPEQLKNALKISGTFKLDGKVGKFDLDLLNNKSGHNIPTGMPTHKVVIVARVFDEAGMEVGEKEFYIERVLGDEKGNALISAEDIFLKAKKVLKDNRVGPKKKKRINISVPVSRVSNELSATVSLFYELPTPDPNLKTTRINFNNISLPLFRGKFPFMVIIIILLIITAALVTYDIIIRKKKND